MSKRGQRAAPVINPCQLASLKPIDPTCADSGAQVLPPARATVPPSLRESSSRASTLPACSALGLPASAAQYSCRREPCTGRSAWLPLGRACLSAWIEHRSGEQPQGAPARAQSVRARAQEVHRSFLTIPAPSLLRRPRVLLITSSWALGAASRSSNVNWLHGLEFRFESRKSIEIKFASISSDFSSVIAIVHYQNSNHVHFLFMRRPAISLTHNGM